jgi:hypothetical protein
MKIEEIQITDADKNRLEYLESINDITEGMWKSLLLTKNQLGHEYADQHGPMAGSNPVCSTKLT